MNINGRTNSVTRFISWIRGTNQRFGMLLISILFLISGCLSFDNDYYEYEIVVVGKISLVKRNTNSSNELVYNESKQLQAGIFEDCNRIFYDSVNKKVFVEKNLGPYYKSYYELVLIDANNASYLSAIKKVEIDSAVFNIKILGLKNIVPTTSKHL